MSREVKIYCPKCSWEPRETDRWYCTECSCSWNTFDTGGVCPSCGKAWTETKCLVCPAWSPHREWYHHFGEDPLEITVEEKVGTTTSS